MTAQLDLFAAAERQTGQSQLDAMGPAERELVQKMRPLYRKVRDQGYVGSDVIGALSKARRLYVESVSGRSAPSRREAPGAWEQVDLAEDMARRLAFDGALAS